MKPENLKLTEKKSRFFREFKAQSKLDPQGRRRVHPAARARDTTSMSGTPLNLIIPLGGIGSRFQKEGYTQPKPFVRVQGKPMIQWLIDRLQAQPQDTLVVIYNPAFLNMQSQMERLGEYLDSIERFKSVRFVKLPGPTRGAAETVGFGIRALSSEEAKNPCMLLDGDCFFTADVVSKYREVAAKGFGASVVFTDTQPKPIYSYVKVDDDQSMKINKIIEKVKISDLANTGCYCFRSGEELRKYIDLIIERGEKQLSQDMKGEFYTSGVIAAMLRDEIPFKAIMVDTKDFTVLGVPKMVKDFCRREVKAGRAEKFRICFDVDNTLVTSPQVSGDYTTCLPIPRAIAYLNGLYDQGHTILISTARRMRTHGGSAGRVVKDIGSLTLQQLDQFGIRYHEVTFCKPWAEHYVGARQINAMDDLDKEMGIYLAEDLKCAAPRKVERKGPAKRGPNAAGTSKGPPMNIIIPLGGIGSRFQKQGYFRPKPFVRVFGKAMIEWLTDRIETTPRDTLVIIYNPSFLTMETNMRALQDKLKNRFNSVQLVRLPGPTRGAAETVLFGLKSLSAEEAKNPCMLMDGDCFFTTDVVSKYREVAAKGFGASVVFTDTQPKPIYSYVKVDDDQSMKINKIIEKVKISDLANTGCYCFRSGEELRKYIDLIIERGEKQLSQDMKGEFYTSGVIAAMLRDEIPFKAIMVDTKDFTVLGTPKHVTDFCGAYKAAGNIEKTRFCFDLESLFTPPKKVASADGKNALPDYSTCRAIQERVEYVRARAAEGHRIEIFCGRGMAESSGDEGVAIATAAPLTLRKLGELGIRCDAIRFGKPSADFYIDDKAISSLDNLGKSSGFYSAAPTAPQSASGLPNVAACGTPGLSLAACLGLGAALAFLVKLVGGMRRT